MVNTISRLASRGFEAELRLSPKVPIAMLAIAGVGLGVVAETLNLLPEAVLAIVLLEVMAGVAWLLNQSRPRLGAWITVVALIGAIQSANSWLHVPGSLALLGIPTALSAALISLAAGAVTSVGETMLLLVLLKSRAAGADAATVGVALTAIWATLGVMFAVYQPVYHLVGWSWGHFQRAQAMLEEARHRRMELRQALEDLAAANLQLTRLNRLAQGLRQLAEEARRAKEEFVANVSHELRTPLNMIVGFSEMIMEAPASYGDIPPALLADLAVIQRNSQHLSSLIDDVLELSQIEAGRVALTRERVALSEVVEAAAVAVRPLFKTKGLYLRAEVPPNLFLYCDRTRVREVLLNLLINAGRFTERGGVDVQARQDANDVVVSVTDTGPGIAKEDQARVFEAFQQLDGSIRRRYGGTGLGLCISKSFVELHGGRMWLESEKGKGATFSFRLPMDPLPPLLDGPARWLASEWEHVQRTRRPQVPATALPCRAVVVEVGKTLQRLLSRHLDEVEMVPTASLEEALQEVSRVPTQVLLINASSVDDALRQLDGRVGLPRGVPVMICSVPGAGEAARALGASDYLVKPITRQGLLEVLDRLCLEGKKVLIVDDEPDALRLFRRMLISSGRGYRVLRATEGRHALNIMREESPDVVLLDLVMPDMDGFQLLAERAVDPMLRDIPVVVISARDPAGQPIVSNALYVTRVGGLSVQQLLRSIAALSQILSITDPSEYRVRTKRTGT